MVISSNFRLSAIWLLVAISSIVSIEPAPYDLLAMVLIVVFFALGLRIPPRLSTALVLLAIFLLANFISAMFAPDPLRGLRYMAITFFLILNWLFFTSVINDDPERTYKVIWHGYIFSATIAVILGIIGYLKLPYYENFMSWDRVKGPFKDPNVYGPYLIPPALYLVYKLESARPGKFFLGLVLALFLTMGILLSFSRGAWVNLVISAFFYGVLRLATARSNRDVSGLLAVGSVILVACIGAFAWAITSADISETFFRRATLVQKYDAASSGGRFATLKMVGEQILQNPIGLGPGESIHTFLLEPHNLYIHTTAETGWLGGLAFCSFLLVSVWQGFLFALSGTKLQGAFIVVFACLLGTLIESMIIHTNHWRHLYLLLAMLWGPMVARDKIAQS